MRQPVLFVMVGGMQYLLDAALYGILLSVGLSIPLANVLSRGAAASGGFLANRYLTFSKRSDTLSSFRASLLRFAILWILMTVISTGVMILLSYVWGTELDVLVAGKLIVEAVLAIISFLISKFWVYRD